MANSRRNLFCGPQWAGLHEVFGLDQANGALSWFENDRVYCVHKARVAIRFACELMNLGQGDCVLAPAYNCGTEIDALRNSNLLVVLYRIDRIGQVDLSDLRSRITEETRAIYVTHYFGFAQPLDEIKNICDKNGLYLIEDCALSMFSTYVTNKSGSIGDISVFNFPKTLPVPDGGVMVINNPKLAIDNWPTRRSPVSRVLRDMLPLVKRYVLNVSSGSDFLYQPLWSLLKRTQSITDHNNKRCNTSFPDIPCAYYYDEKLNNRKISRITKRMLRTFDISEIVRRRRANFHKYLELLSEVAGVQPLYKKLPSGVCPLYFPIIVNQRSHVCLELNVLSIGAIAWWAGYHRSLPWAEYPDACFLKDNLLVLPVHQQLNDRHIEFITQKLLDVVDKVRA